MAQANKTDHIGRLSNLSNVVQLGQWVFRAVLAVSAFALPAWAARAANFMGAYAPLSWVGVGFLGLIIAACAYALAGWGRSKWVKSRYDARMFPKSGPIDPMDKTFERRRIYLNEFALPSHPLVAGKTFIDCEIIGPANIILEVGNRVTEHQYPICDAILMNGERTPYNGYLFRHCTFRGCSFQRITLLVPKSEYDMAKGVDWLNWITAAPPNETQTLDLQPNTSALAQAMVEYAKDKANDDKSAE